MRAYDARKKFEMMGAMVLRLPAGTTLSPENWFHWLTGRLMYSWRIHTHPRGWTPRKWWKWGCSHGSVHRFYHTLWRRSGGPCRCCPCTEPAERNHYNMKKKSDRAGAVVQGQCRENVFPLFQTKFLRVTFLKFCSIFCSNRQFNCDKKSHVLKGDICRTHLWFMISKWGGRGVGSYERK